MLADDAATISAIVRRVPVERLRAERFGDWTALDLIGHVADTAALFAMRVRRAPSFGGRKPSKKNRSVGRPATASAASAADGPGTAFTGNPASQAARTSLKPGSEISGVPASETSAIASPAASRIRSFGRAATAL